MNLFISFVTFMIVVILIVVLYMYFNTGSSTLISTKVTLNAQNPPIVITNSPTSVRYSIGDWIYVNSWNNASAKPLVGLTGIFQLYLDSTSPTLYVDMIESGSSGTGPEAQKFIITNNFPLQKWVYVHLSVDSQNIDMYIDGKMVKSVQMTKVAQSNTTVTSYFGHNIPGSMAQFGGKYFNGTYVGSDIMMSDFRRWTAPLSPVEVWTQYSNGNTGGGSMMKSSYGMNVGLTKDNAETARYNVF